MIKQVAVSAIAVVVSIASSAATAQISEKSRAQCEKEYKPQVGQSGKDVVWVPTPDELINRMLKMANVTSKDVVFDLGAGDGKIAIAAGKLGANSTGIEYNPEMAKLAQCLVKAEGVGDKVRVIQGDIFKEDFSKATVVTMYLLPELNIRLRPTILDMKPGTRVVSHQFTMGDWKADQTSEMDYRTAYFWVVPAKVAGTWQFKEAGGATNFAVNLSQKYQEISGDASMGANKNPLVGASLRGEDIKFAFNDESGTTRTLNGTVRGNEITGVLSGGGKEIKVVGTRK